MQPKIDYPDISNIWLADASPLSLNLLLEDLCLQFKTWQISLTTIYKICVVSSGSKLFYDSLTFWTEMSITISFCRQNPDKFFCSWDTNTSWSSITLMNNWKDLITTFFIHWATYSVLSHFLFFIKGIVVMDTWS